MQDRPGNTGQPGTNTGLLSEILDRILDGIFVLDQTWNFTYINHQAAIDAGFLPEDLIGRNLWKIFPQILGTPYEAHYREAMAGRKSQQFELDGLKTSKRYMVTVSPVNNGIMVHWRDITERQQAQNKLEENEKRLWLLIENAPASIAMFDTQMRYLAVSRRWLKDYNLVGQKIIGRSHYDVFPEIPERWKEIHRRCLAGASESSEEDMFQRIDGSIQWLRWEIIPWYKADKEIGGIIIISEDITRRKQTEEALIKAKEELEIKVKERTQELARSEEKYRKVVENANEIIAIAQDGVIKFMGGKTIGIAGYRPDEIISKPFLNVVFPDDRARMAENYQKLIAGEPAPSMIEIRVVRKDGSVRWAQLNAAKITWEDRPAILGMFTDITERKNMEQELKIYARKITQVQEEERKRIAYELHDDTAQYLAILKLELDSLLNSGKIKDPEILNKLKYLEQDAGRAVNDVRRYSHELRPGVLEHLGLSAALEQIAGDFNKLNEIPLEVSVVGTEPEMPEEIKLGFFRIAQEAITNARKHSNATQINVQVSYHGNRTHMVISDDGVGFDVQKEKTRTQTEIRGSLGLMSMQERAKLIGADLKIESKPGKGTSIILEAKI